MVQSATGKGVLKMDNFKGKTVLVTGGSRGLGEAFCRKFAELGCRVIVNYAHGREAAEAVAKEIGGIALPCDISSEKSVGEMFEQIGGVDLLINNARIDPYKRTPEMTDGEWWDEVMSVNLKGSYLCAKFAFEDMKKKNWGRMLHISSIWAYQPANERMLSYAAAKSAMHAMSRGYANLGASYGITSNVLAPGLIMTKLISERLSPEALEKELSTIPLHRGETPEEIAEAGINMMRSGFITGEVLNINGGAFMRP